MPGNIGLVNNAPRFPFSSIIYVQSEQKHCRVRVAQLAKNSPAFTEREVMPQNISKRTERKQELTAKFCDDVTDRPVG